jgi:hypothetical protein
MRKEDIAAARVVVITRAERPHLGTLPIGLPDCLSDGLSLLAGESHGSFLRQHQGIGCE